MDPQEFGSKIQTFWLVRFHFDFYYLLLYLVNILFKVGVKCEVQTAEDTEVTPNRLRFSVDCSANASPEFEGFHILLSHLNNLYYRKRW